MSKKNQRWNYKRIAFFIIFVIVAMIVLISLIIKIFSSFGNKDDKKLPNKENITNDKFTNDKPTNENSTKNGSNNENENIEALSPGSGIWNIKFDEDYFEYENSTPVSYTIDEVKDKLDKLKEINKDFEMIYNNIDICPEELLIALLNNMELKGYVVGYINKELDNTDSIFDDATTENTTTENTTTENTTTTTSNKFDISTILYNNKSYPNKTDFPLILQWDERWGYDSYGKSNIAVSGCGPACLTMIVNYLKPEIEVDIIEIADYCNDNGYYVYGSGTDWRTMREVPNTYKISVEELPLVETYINDNLDKGRILICSVNQGDFTRDGHFIVIYGYDENGYFVNDPNSIRRSLKQWSFEQLSTQISNIWSYYLQ